MTHMIKKIFNLTKSQVDFLKSLSDVSVTEHVRRAIDEYIDRIKEKQSAESPSKEVYGERG